MYFFLKKAYDLPNIDDLKLKKKKPIIGMNLYPQQNRRRTGFSSLQKELSAMNMTYNSFMLRKIEEFQKKI